MSILLICAGLLGLLYAAIAYNVGRVRGLKMRESRAPETRDATGKELRLKCLTLRFNATHSFVLTFSTCAKINLSSPALPGTLWVRALILRWERREPEDR